MNHCITWVNVCLTVSNALDVIYATKKSSSQQQWRSWSRSEYTLYHLLINWWNTFYKHILLIQVYVGTNLQYALDRKLRFVRHAKTEPASSLNPLYLLPFVSIPIFLLCSIIYLLVWFCLRQRRTRRKGVYNVTTKEFQIGKFSYMAFKYLSSIYKCCTNNSNVSNIRLIF